MADQLVTRAKIEACIGAVTVQRLFDHNNDGAADKPSIDLICDQASSKVRGALPGHDPATLTAANALISTELARLALNAALAQIAIWFPGSTPFNGFELMAQTDRELEMVRRGQANLGSRSNPAEADHAVSVVSGLPGGDFWP